MEEKIHICISCGKEVHANDVTISDLGNAYCEECAEDDEDEDYYDDVDKWWEE